MTLKNAKVEPWKSTSAVLATAIATAHAAGLEPPRSPASSPAPDSRQQVEIKGARAADDGRDETTMRTVVRRADIEKFGDTQLSDVLRRINGVSVTTSAGKPPEVRLRGLGSGYARVLINGEAPPAGFSIDTVAPSLIDRIEVVRAATADSSSQAIAGTVNIILTGTTSAVEKSFQIGAGVQDDRPSMLADFRWSDRQDGLRRSFNGSLQRDPTDTTSHRTRRTRDVPGGTAEEQEFAHLTTGTSKTFNLGGGLQDKRPEGWSWRWESSLRHRVIDEADDEFSAPGDPFPVPTVHQRSSLGTTSIQTKGRVERNLADEAKLEFGLSLSGHHRLFESDLESSDATGTLLRRSVESLARTWTPLFDGKYRVGWIDDHDVVTGWELENARRYERQITQESSQASGPLDYSSEDFQTDAAHAALFVQDEWKVNKAVAAYLGLRGELVSTRTVGTSIEAVHQTHTLLSPVLQAVYRVSDVDQGQLRAALGRTYKVPNPRDLIPVRSLAVDNSVLTPDEEGNPSLRPEAAWGLDLSYGQRIFGATQLSLTSYARHIDDVTLRESFIEDGRWIERRTNGGRALAYGLELEATTELNKLGASWPKAQLTAYVARNASRLLDVAGSNRRLDQQAPLIGKMSWEHSLADSPWKWGGQVLYEQASSSRLSGTRSKETDNRTTLDLYAVWTPMKGHSARLSITNVLGADKTEGLDARTESLEIIQRQEDQAAPAVKFTWRMPM